MYTWGTESADAAELSPDDFAYAVSELRFRSDLLSRFEEIQNTSSADFVAEGTDCSLIITTASTALDAAKAALTPDIAANLGAMKAVLDAAFNTIGTALSIGLQVAVIPLNFALPFVLKVLSAIKTVTVPVPGIDALESLINTLVGEITLVTACLTVGSNKLFTEATTCNNIADLYRIAVAEAAKISPALNLPESASVDLRRLAAGSLSVLDLMGKSAIATTNEGLLAIRPIFATDLLNQFREELLRAESVDIKTYAQRDLGVVVGISNALEACLRIAADPIAAIDDLNEELEAAAEDYDDEDDIDEYEDDEDDEYDEDDEDEADEAPEQQQ